MMMKSNPITIKYNKRKIRLDYKLTDISLDDSNIKINASGQGTDYRKAEQEAQLYLIKNAIDKSTHFHKLERIVNVQQSSTDYNPGMGDKTVRVVLEGIGVFR